MVNKKIIIFAEKIKVTLVTYSINYWMALCSFVTLINKLAVMFKKKGQFKTK